MLQQLTAVKWKYHSNGKIILVDKKTLKESLGGRSPDRADAYIMGLDGLQYAKTKIRKDDGRAAGWSNGSYVPEWTQTETRSVLR